MLSLIRQVYERNETYMVIFNAMGIVSECDPNEGYKPDIYSIDMQLSVEDRNKVAKCYETHVIKAKHMSAKFLVKIRILLKLLARWRRHAGDVRFIVGRIESRVVFPRHSAFRNELRRKDSNSMHAADAEFGFD